MKILAWVLLAAALLGVAWTGHEEARTTRAEIRQLQEQVAALSGEVKGVRDMPRHDDEILAWLTTPELSGLEVVKIGKITAKSRPYNFRRGTDPMALGRYKMSLTWEPKHPNPEENLPYPWPEAYIKKGQAFNADSFLYNATSIAWWVKQTGRTADAQPYAALLIKRLREYLVPSVEGGLLVTFKFPHEFHGTTLAPGWVSSYANASVLAGLLRLAEFAPVDSALTAAVFNGFKAVDGPGKWISAVDSSQYLWFEEIPFEGDPKAHILNGHIWSVLAIELYYEATGDQEALAMARAGVTTVERYLGRFRYPGKVNRYDLYAPYNPDYLPKNTIDQEMALYRLTGEPVFKRAAERFMVDMRYGKP